MNESQEIMVVDDEVEIRDLLSELLSSRGFRVALAMDGQDSLEKMQTRHFDLLITDIHMPRLDGIGLLREMKKEGRSEKVIVMSGGPMDRRLLEADTTPVFTMLQKPFPLVRFLDAVSSALKSPRKRHRDLMAA